MTLTDIAKALNLSVPTVSKALNGSMEIAEDTKKRICDYAQSVGYRSRKSVTIIGRLAVLWGRQPRAGEPLPEIAQAFRDAAENARYIVESDIMDDVGGAHGVGMRCLYLQTEQSGKYPNPPVPDFRARDLKDALGILTALL